MKNISPLKERHQQLLYLLISNGILLYGILALGWPLFPLVYLWWWEGVIETIVNIVFRKSRREKDAGFGELFLYGIYWVFIIVFVGLMGTPDGQRLLTLGVVFFQIPLFNLSLLILLLHLGFRFMRVEYIVPPPGITMGHIRLHVGIILGALALAFTPKLGLDGKMMMALVMLGIKMLLDWFSYRVNFTTS